MSVEERKINLNPEALNGKARDIRKKPHVTYAASKDYSLVKLPYFILTVIWTTQKCLIYVVYVLTVWK
jgi:hypothetical protein